MATADALILRVLRGSGGTEGTHGLTLPQIANAVGESESSTRERIAALGEAGFGIELHPHYGFRLVSEPDRLIADDLEARLQGQIIGRCVRVFRSTSSTNDLALRMGSEGEAEGMVVFAEEQTGGRGRFGRKWESMDGRGLWLSVLLRPVISPARWPRFTLWAALSVAEALEEVAGIRTQIKWPNDILVEDRKVVGILLESRVTKDLGYLVVGIGINVNHVVEDFPEPLQATASSLQILSGRPFARDVVAEAILRRMEHWRGMVETRFEEIIEGCKVRSSVLGRWISVQSGSETLSGTAEDFDSEGALLLRMSDGTLRTVL